MRTMTLAVAAAVTALVAGLLPSRAVADTVTPGDFTGYAFDTCDAPSQQTMDRWLTSSKYAGVGVYVAGVNRACKEQRHLTRGWVAEQSRKGWRVLPIVVGRQASCAPQGHYAGRRISPDPRGDYGSARRQGRQEATAGVQAVRRLGIQPGSVVWFDLEHFDLGRARCRLSALAFLSAWTSVLHARGHQSGLYSSASSGITMVDQARRESPGRYALPDYLWVAEWDGRETVRSAYLGTEGWWPHRRVHQYQGDHRERHGGVRLHIDSNFLSTGRGTVAGPSRSGCRVAPDLRSFPVLRRGDSGPQVATAQCLLRQQRVYAGRQHGRFDRVTLRAVQRFQRRHPALPVTGLVRDRTWTALLSAGPTPLLKYGSGGEAVRRLQRALNASAGARLEVDGVFSRPELRAVLHYQRHTRAERTGVVTDATWQTLQSGRTVSRMPALTARQIERLFDRIRASTVIPFSSGAGP